MKLPPVRVHENLHVILWLFKDLSWLMEYKLLGLVMVLPTVLVAVLIAWESRRDRSELFHACAVILWILANSTWMIEDFFFNAQGHAIAQAFFLSGLALLAIYYTVFWPLERKKVQDGSPSAP
ncbi:MAG: hypothetical protein JNM62_14545 [Flavobacteriales bacterium]|nr:hypothetical protein [Flavobacteriales bacterium]